MDLPFDVVAALNGCVDDGIEAETVECGLASELFFMSMSRGSA